MSAAFLHGADEVCMLPRLVSAALVHDLWWTQSSLDETEAGKQAR